MSQRVVIIGSGLGGLLSAVFLAKEGYQVKILEKNKQVGGCLQSFAFDKKVFDSAVHYIGSLAPGQVLHRVFDYAGIMHQLRLKQLDESCFDKIAFGDAPSTFAWAQGLPRFKASLIAAFPQEQEALNQYFELLEQSCAAVPLFNLRMGTEAEKYPYSEWSLSEVMGRIGASEALQSVLTGNAILYAGKEQQTPWLSHALVSKSYIDSAWRCEGGASQIAKLLWRQLRVLGGSIERHEEVCRLSTRKGKIVSAVTRSGKCYEGDIFIANVHPKMLVPLLDEPTLLSKVYRQRLSSAKETIACVMLNIALAPGMVRYRNHNFNWFATNPLKAIEGLNEHFPVNYAIYYTEDAKRPGFAESVSILAYINAEAFADWEGSRNTSLQPQHRGTDYEMYKNEIANKLLDKVAERFPELRANCRAWRLASPLTFRDYQGAACGSLYGLLKDSQNAAATNFSVKTRIPNLLLTGQNVNLHGILGVAMTAILSAGAVVGLEPLLSKIKAS